MRNPVRKVDVKLINVLIISLGCYVAWFNYGRVLWEAEQMGTIVPSKAMKRWCVVQTIGEPGNVNSSQSYPKAPEPSSSGECWEWWTAINTPYLTLSFHISCSHHKIECPSKTRCVSMEGSWEEVCLDNWSWVNPLMSLKYQQWE